MMFRLVLPSPSAEPIKRTDEPVCRATAIASTGSDRMDRDAHGGIRGADLRAADDPIQAVLRRNSLSAGSPHGAGPVASAQSRAPPAGQGAAGTGHRPVRRSRSGLADHAGAVRD